MVIWFGCGLWGFWEVARCGAVDALRQSVPLGVRLYGAATSINWVFLTLCLQVENPGSVSGSCGCVTYPWNRARAAPCCHSLSSPIAPPLSLMLCTSDRFQKAFGNDLFQHCHIEGRVRVADVAAFVAFTISTLSYTVVLLFGGSSVDMFISFFPSCSL
ncbi:hypothetical protein PIB30_000356 [Stylosanthes scabra]|uniref:CASP-like protein n=1 Tax=Stylosanthes scabra TaxID=79078 RepID=A0ABU6U140_9FABA|nr:hypothetical protein [Stylosanthes scabra]